MKAEAHKTKLGTPAMAIEIINEGHVIPIISAEAEHSEVGFAEVAGLPTLRRLFFYRQGMIVNNNVIVGNN